jgi:phosphoribosylanthranilate isomerase
MTPVIVKICGITRLEDAEAAVASGAAAIGFVFWPRSPRFIDPFRAARISAALPPFVMAVGVFVNQPVEYVNGVAAVARLGAVQLHGDEDVAVARAIVRPIIKSFSVDGGTPDVSRWPARVMPLLDVDDPARRGGTGRTIDWSAAAAVARQRRVLLAGGLTPENVAEAVARVRPFGVDVSSGVETAPGIKNPERLRALFEALHATSEHAARS